MNFDPRGFEAQCIDCGRTFYIPWETMCDAGFCDECVEKRKKADASPKEPRDGQ